MKRSWRNEILLGVFFFFVLLLLVYLFHVLGGKSMADEIEVAALFDNAAGLVNDNHVMVAGVPVGSVKGIEVAGGKARVLLRVQRAADLRQGARARIRPKSLLGEKYVELLPGPDGRAAPLKDGDTITDTGVAVEMDEVFGSLQPFFEQLGPMAPSLRSTLEELDGLLAELNKTGKSKRETLERIIDRGDALLETANRMLDANEVRLNRAATNMDALTATLSRRAPALLERADKALARVEEVAAAIPVDTLRRVPASYDKLDHALDRVLPIVERLDRSGERLDSILKNLDLILGRVAAIDELAVRRFLQDEGVNINITQDAASKKRIKELEKETAQPKAAPSKEASPKTR